MIHASGGMGKNSGICYHTTYNDNSMQSEIIYFWSFPIQYFKPWLVTVAETLEHEMVGNKVVSVSPEVSTMLFLLEITSVLVIFVWLFSIHLILKPTGYSTLPRLLA